MNKKIIALLAALVLCFSVFVGCAPTAPAESQTPAPSESASASASAEASASVPAANAALTDMAGNEITIEKADKIVSLTPAGTETVCALGASKQLVGIDAYSNYPEITQSIEVVGDFNGPDVEKVAALEPDVVLAGTGLQKEAVEQLNKLGIPVAVVEATTFEEIGKSITLVGDIVGAPDEAKQLVDGIDQVVKTAEGNKPAEAKTVYYAMSYGDQGNWTSGPGSFINTMIELAGGKCVTQSVEYPWVEYPVEDLVVANPDIIIVGANMGSTADLSTVQGYKDLDAVKNGNVYTVDADTFTRPGPRIGEALLEISEILNK